MIAPRMFHLTMGFALLAAAAERAPTMSAPSRSLDGQPQEMAARIGR